MSVGKADVTRTNRNFNAMRGVIQRILGGNDARPGQVAHALDGVFRITRQPLDGRFADLVLRTFRHLEHDADLAIVVRDLVRPRDLRVQIAVVPVDCGQLVATLRQLVGGDGTVGKPAKRIPPREVVNRRVQFRYVNHFRLQHVTRLHRLPNAHVDGMVGSLERIIGHLLPDTLGNDQRDIDVIAADHFRLVDNLCIRIVLLLIGKTHLRRSRRKIGLTIQPTVLQPGLLGNLRLTELVVALDD